METNKIPVQRPKTTSSTNSTLIEQLKELNDQMEYANHRLESIEENTDATRGAIKAILWIFLVQVILAIATVIFSFGSLKAFL